MRNIDSDSRLKALEQRVIHWAHVHGRTLPEMRFFILDGMEFASLLEKHVYPTSPINIWEGKSMVSRRYRIEEGLESSIYYEVVQTGNPSYAYLNDTNSECMQASVMAHVVGHCEFSELNVLRDSNLDRTEHVMHLVRKVDLGRRQMGDLHYTRFWNAAESVVDLIAPNSQYNLQRSVDSETRIQSKNDDPMEQEELQGPYMPFSSTMDALLVMEDRQTAFEREIRQRQRQETLSRRGYKLRAPCQDVLGFLRSYAPATQAERNILDYLYVTHQTHDFVIRTQIMNEGWAMTWENTIMHELFKERAVGDIIDYCKVFSGVCFPRPWFQRNPYHLGYHMWRHIKQLYADGKVTLEYAEEISMEKRENWKKPQSQDPLAAMEHLVSTVTDYEFLRRFLTPELIHEFQLNRLHKQMAQRLGISPKDVVQESQSHVWINPEPIKTEMLNFFTHFYRPRIYIIDTDFQDGGLLLMHRNDGRRLREDWVKPTLRNLNMIWKGPVSLVSSNTLYGFSANTYKETAISEVSFEQVTARMQRDEKPFNVG
ncbi:MAG: SpoVR family protein [Calditrichaeota bacterium]|nr:SpoVR family protein [Candidatus Cloacimonadota bacterium]MCB1047011.1 SpoVR family protein [Calditrichota bacterium]MCB9473584.1 SpoVR family protein [Candidatus Delongbacteria bacterium]